MLLQMLKIKRISRHKMFTGFQNKIGNHLVFPFCIENEIVKYLLANQNLDNWLESILMEKV